MCVNSQQPLFIYTCVRWVLGSCPDCEIVFFSSTSTAHIQFLHPITVPKLWVSGDKFSSVKMSIPVFSDVSGCHVQIYSVWPSGMPLVFKFLKMCADIFLQRYVPSGTVVVYWSLFQRRRTNQWKEISIMLLFKGTVHPEICTHPYIKCGRLPGFPQLIKVYWFLNAVDKKQKLTWLI